MITSWPRETRSVPSVSGESIAFPPGLSVIDSTSMRGSAASSCAIVITRRLLSVVISPRLVTTSAATTKAPGRASFSRNVIIVAPPAFSISVCLIYDRRMADLQVLNDETALTVERVCEAIVPGSARVRPVVYVDALLAHMDEGTRGAALAAFATVASGEIEQHVRTPEFAWVRVLAIEAFYSDFVAPERMRPARGPRSTSTPRSPRGWRRTGRTWESDERAVRRRRRRLRCGRRRRGGRARRPRSYVLLLEFGPHLTAADFTRWEAKATHDLWWPIRFALIDGGAGGAMPLLGGRCVGGTTTINTKVALRAHEKDYAKWHEASGIVGSGGAPFGAGELDPHYGGSSRGSACESAATGARACARSSRRSARSARRSSR